MLSRFFVGRAEEGIPQGLKPPFVDGSENAKAEALAHLEARKSNGKGLSLQRWVLACLVCVLAVVMLGADPSSRFNKVGHEMICTCGCGQVLLECNHVGCPVSPVMINELHTLMDGGGSNTSILNWFAAKYGATVLASPIRGGFDNVAWIAPMAVFFLATIGTGFLILIWKRRSDGETASVPMDGGVGVMEADAMRERIRRE